MSEQEARIEELERPAEELTEQAAAEVHGGGWTLQAGPANLGPTSGNTSDSSKQTRQTSIVQDL